MIFIWLCPLPFVKYHSPCQIASKKGNCELKYIKISPSILGKIKLKILHQRTYYVWLTSTFYVVKSLFIWLCSRHFVEYHPQLQFGTCHFAPQALPGPTVMGCWRIGTWSHVHGGHMWIEPRDICFGNSLTYFKFVRKYACCTNTLPDLAYANVLHQTLTVWRTTVLRVINRRTPTFILDYLP